MESWAGGNASEKANQSKPPALPSTQTFQLEPADKKRKWDQKGKKVMDERRRSPSKEAEAERGGKQAKVIQMRSFSEGAITERKTNQQAEVLVWTPVMVLDGAPFPSIATLRDF